MNEQEVSTIVDAIRSRKPNGEFYLTERSCISAITTMKSLEPKVEDIFKVIDNWHLEHYEERITPKGSIEYAFYNTLAISIVNYLKGKE